MVDYNYYKCNFLGEKIADEKEFVRLERVACKYLSKILPADFAEEDLEACSEAVCAACELLYDSLAAGSLLIAGESVDGYSVTYNEGSIESAVYSLFKLYLPAKYIYRGI